MVLREFLVEGGLQDACSLPWGILVWVYGGVWFCMH